MGGGEQVMSDERGGNGGVATVTQTLEVDPAQRPEKSTEVPADWPYPLTYTDSFNTQVGFLEKPIDDETTTNLLAEEPKLPKIVATNIEELFKRLYQQELTELAIFSVIAVTLHRPHSVSEMIHVYRFLKVYTPYLDVQINKTQAQHHNLAKSWQSSFDDWRNNLGKTAQDTMHKICEAIHPHQNR
jgi:hypothetical protein